MIEAVSTHERLTAVMPLEASERAHFSEWTAHDWALQIVNVFGPCQAAEHRAWTLDQVSRVLHGTEVIPGIAAWTNGRVEHRFWLAAPSERYLRWREVLRAQMRRTWNYDEGIAPTEVSWEGWLPLFSSHQGHRLRSIRPSMTSARATWLLS